MKTGVRPPLALRPAPRRGEGYSNEYETPRWFFDTLQKEFGEFTLDVCATPAMAKCTRFYTAQDNCLRFTWDGEQAFCNPPYSEGAIGPIIAHVLSVTQRGRSNTLCLFPAKKSEFDWYQESVAGSATLICAVDDRIPFLWQGTELDQPNHASVLVWYRAGSVAPPGSHVLPVSAAFDQRKGFAPGVKAMLRDRGLL